MSTGGPTVIGWRLDRGERERLLDRLPPAFGRVVADHVTLAAGVPPDAALPGEEQAWIVGRASDGAGVEALVVRIGGATDRPGGGTYHITWSLGPGREAIESNDVIAAHGWSAIAGLPPVRLIPARWP